MTLATLLARIDDAGISLRADGDRLRASGPPGTLTDDVRRALIAHKPVLMRAYVAPRRFVPLRGGLVLPVQVVELGLALKARGVPLITDGDHRLVLPAPDLVTEDELAALHHWRQHLSALVEYSAPEVA